MRLRTVSLILLLSVAAMASPDLRLEGGPFLPYRINHAVASDAEGMLGSLELAGQRWDGSRVTLFRTFLKARSEAVDLVFYLDEDIRGLELKVEGQGTVRTSSVDLAAGEGRSGAITEGEVEARDRMRRLDPPVHLTPEGSASERFSLMGSDVVMAGFQASSLFGLPVSRVPLLLLGGFALLALAAAAIPSDTTRGKVWARTLAIVASLGATIAVVLLTAHRPTLFTVAFADDGPGARVSGVLERRIDELPGYTRMAYAAGQEEGPGLPKPDQVELVGIWAPTDGGIPVTDVVPPGSLVRFSSPPTATVAEGEALLGSKDFITGWVVHAGR